MHRSLRRIRRTLTKYIRREKGKGINKKAIHGQIRHQGRYGLPALAKRSAIKMDLAGIKGFEIIGGAYGMIKGGLQKKK